RYFQSRFLPFLLGIETAAFPDLRVVRCSGALSFPTRGAQPSRTQLRRGRFVLPCGRIVPPLRHALPHGVHRSISRRLVLGASRPALGNHAARPSDRDVRAAAWLLLLDFQDTSRLPLVESSRGANPLDWAVGIGLWDDVHLPAVFGVETATRGTGRSLTPHALLSAYSRSICILAPVASLFFSVCNQHSHPDGYARAGRVSRTHCRVEEKSALGKYGHCHSAGGEQFHLYRARGAGGCVGDSGRLSRQCAIIGSLCMAGWAFPSRCCGPCRFRNFKSHSAIHPQH